jgi:hypothetical protein
MKVQRWFPARAQIVRPVVAGALAVFLIALAAVGGIERGMDHKVAYGPWDEQRAISVAISESVYGLHLGYVGFRSVFDALVQVWNRGAKDDEDPILIKNSSDAGLMNGALHAAVSLGPQSVGYLSDGSLVTMQYDDMGEVDFQRLAFWLFGLKIQSYYYLFFVLLTLSSLIFVATFRDSVYILATLLCALFAFYIELYLNVFSPYAPTFPGMRNGSSLGLVPMWYFAFLLLFRRRLTFALSAGATVQLAVLILAWRIRGSTIWVFLFLFAIGLVMALIDVWPAISQGLRASPGSTGIRRFRSAAVGGWFALRDVWPLLLRGVLRWPIALLLIGIIANGIYNGQSRHLIYSTDDVLPYHGPWWSAVYGLHMYDAHLFGPRIKETGGTPEGWWYLRDYMDRIHLIPWTGVYDMSKTPAPGLMSPWTGAPKSRLVEETFKRIFFDTIVHHPLDVLRVILRDKTIAVLQRLKSAFAGASSFVWIFLMLLSNVMVFCGMLVANGAVCYASLRKVLILSSAAVVGSALPNIWAFASADAAAPGYVMADVVLLCVTFLSLAPGLGAYAAFSRLREAKAKHGAMRNEHQGCSD